MATIKIKAGGISTSVTNKDLVVGVDTPGISSNVPSVSIVVSDVGHVVSASADSPTVSAKVTNTDLTARVDNKDLTVLDGSKTALGNITYKDISVGVVSPSISVSSNVPGVTASVSTPNIPADFYQSSPMSAEYDTDINVVTSGMGEEHWLELAAGLVFADVLSVFDSVVFEGTMVIISDSVVTETFSISVPESPTSGFAEPSVISEVIVFYKQDYFASDYVEPGYTGTITIL